MDALIVIDMQQRMHDGISKHDLAGVASRINRLARKIRDRGGQVIFIQHEDAEFAPGSEGWKILDELERDCEDRVVSKSYNDAFFETALASELNELSPNRVIMTGWATDMCVDATVRSAAVLGFKVVAVRDATTVGDRDHLSAEQIIDHHHWAWTNVISKHPVALLNAAEI